MFHSTRNYNKLKNFTRSISEIPIRATRAVFQQINISLEIAFLIGVLCCEEVWQHEYGNLPRTSYNAFKSTLCWNFCIKVRISLQRWNPSAQFLVVGTSEFYKNVEFHPHRGFHHTIVSRYRVPIANEFPSLAQIRSTCQFSFNNFHY